MSQLEQLSRSLTIRGRQIRDAREREGLTQQQLAQRIGASSGITVSRWETGANGVHPRFLPAVCKRLGFELPYRADEPIRRGDWVDDILARLAALEGKVENIDTKLNQLVVLVIAAPDIEDLMPATNGYRGPLDFTCPTCGSEPGELCQMHDGREKHTPHRQRREPVG